MIVSATHATNVALTFFGLLAGCIAGVAHANTKPPLILEIASFEAPPFQSRESGEVSGTAVRTLNCTLERLGWRHNLRIYPHKRAIQRLMSGQADAMLSLTPEHLRDMTTVAHSSPIAMEKWLIYSHLNNRKLHRDVGAGYFGRLGVVMGSSQESWALNRGYPIQHRVVDIDILLNMFALKRFESMLVDYYEISTPQHREQINKLAGIDPHFVKYVPKVLAFSQNFVTHQPEFITAFDRELQKCLSESLCVENSEKNIIRQKMRGVLEQIYEIPGLLEKVAEQNRENTFHLEDYERLDEIWVTPGKSAEKQQLITHVLENTISDALRLIKQRQRGAVHEIIVTDKLGFNAHVTDVTTDFYQGDEDKFRKVASPNYEEFFASGIEYDASSTHFLVHISFPLLDRAGDTIGAVILGVDPEIVLANEHLWGVSKNVNADGTFADRF